MLFIGCSAPSSWTNNAYTLAVVAAFSLTLLYCCVTHSLFRAAVSAVNRPQDCCLGSSYSAYPIAFYCVVRLYNAQWTSAGLSFSVYLLPDLPFGLLWFSNIVQRHQHRFHCWQKNLRCDDFRLPRGQVALVTVLGAGGPHLSANPQRMRTTYPI